MSWVQTSYLIAEIVMIPLSGMLSRLLSTRILFVISAAGFTVSFHSRPGGHDFETWARALQESLPWAAARLGA